MNPQRNSNRDTIAGVVAVVLAIIGGIYLAGAVVSAIGHDVSAVARDVDAITPGPGAIPDALVLYLAAWALVYGYALNENKDGKARFGLVVAGLAVLGVSYYLINKTQPFVFISTSGIRSPVYSCGSWNHPSFYTALDKPTYCISQLDVMFRWGFAIAIGGLAAPLAWTAWPYFRRPKTDGASAGGGQ